MNLVAKPESNLYNIMDLLAIKWYLEKYLA